MFHCNKGAPDPMAVTKRTEIAMRRAGTDAGSSQGPSPSPLIWHLQTDPGDSRQERKQEHRCLLAMVSCSLSSP